MYLFSITITVAFKLLSSQVIRIIYTLAAKNNNTHPIGIIQVLCFRLAVAWFQYSILQYYANKSFQTVKSCVHALHIETQNTAVVVGCLWFVCFLRQDITEPIIYIVAFGKSFHYTDVIMGAMASQITSLAIVYATVYSGADQRKHQSSASLAFVRGIHRWSVNSPHKWPVTRKMFPFDDFIMILVLASAIVLRVCA